jgi:hypothetical protein
MESVYLRSIFPSKILLDHWIIIISRDKLFVKQSPELLLIDKIDEVGSTSGFDPTLTLVDLAR